jgi:hypothetical protein
MRRHLAPLLLLLAAHAAPVPGFAARPAITEVPLETLSIPAIDPAPFAKVKVRIDGFADTRGGEPATLGESRPEEGDPVPITTPDDVAAFATDRFLALAGDLGVPVVDDRLLRSLGADLVDKTATIVRLKGSVTGFALIVGKGLETEVRLAVEVADAEGKGIWSGSSAGRVGRFARSYKVGDAQEAFSDALQEAIAQLLRTPDFVRALSGRR